MSSRARHRRLRCIFAGCVRRSKRTRRGRSISRQFGAWGTSLSRSAALPRSMANMRDWLGLALALVCAVVIALVLAQLLMSPPRRDLLVLAAYLAGSGAVTVLAGAVV